MSGAEEANVAVARSVYELWNAGGLEAVVEQFFAPDIVAHSPPEFPDAGVYHGAEAVVARLRGIFEAVGPYHLTVRSLEGRGDWVLASLEIRIEGAGSGAVAAAPYFQLARYAEDRVREVRGFFDADEARREYERLAGPPGG